MNIGFVGGDLRQITLLECFKKAGHEVKIFGYSGAEENVDSFEELNGCEVLIFPLPSCSGDCVFAPMSKEKIHISDLNLKGHSVIFYAGSNEMMNSKIMSSGALCINYLNNDVLSQKNAIATAEGTLEIVIDETAETVFGSKVLITGFGKVAKAVARIFNSLGADVAICARRAEALAEAYCERYKTLDFNGLKTSVCDYDVIINTVPALVFDKDVLELVKDDSLIIDLASKPGGVDFESAGNLNKKVIWALSLPGKVAPVTSGKIIYETINSILEEGWFEADGD